MALEITAARPDPSLLDLPWSVPLEEWPDQHLAALPRGISRHVVRFVKVSGKVIAVKEIKADVALREYNMLRFLKKIGEPCVQPFGVVSGRTTADGEELDACLLTRHLHFSLPYRALFSQSLRPDTAQRLIDALAVLLVRLHLAGFWWGDVSCPTRCSAGTRVRFRHTSLMPRPARSAARSPTGSASTTSTSPGSTSPAS
jgi:hypothetical protein